MASCVLQLEAYISAWRNADYGVQRTSSYLSYVGPNGPIRNVANTALLARLYATYYPKADKPLACWAEFEARSLLGDGQRSYVVGSKFNPPLRPQHKVRPCFASS